MDALSAMANIAGYRAVIEAANHFGRFFPGQMTAAGRAKPAQVLVLGAGVAGLAAIAAARSLGAVVRAFDTRPAVREQVESLGAHVHRVQFNEAGEGEGGYAKEMSEAYVAAEQALIAQHAKQSDIIITTALIPGKPAPQLITSGAVVSMAHGLGRSSTWRPSRAATARSPSATRSSQKFGVTIIGFTDLPSRMARQSSDLYATTVYNLLKDLVRTGGNGDGPIQINLEDEVHRGVLVLKDGELMWPPPKPPPPRAAAPLAGRQGRAAAGGADQRRLEQPARAWRLGAAIALLGAAGLFGPPEFLQHLTVFLLACVVGWHVVWNVTPALHTPLMSVTNAISGIILIGGMLVVAAGAGAARARWPASPRFWAASPSCSRRSTSPAGSWSRSACCGCSGSKAARA